DPGSIALLVVLFLVGGWGLGRDLELSERAARLSIEAERSKVEAERTAIEAQRASLAAERSAILAQQSALLAQESAILAQQNALLAQRAQLDPHFLFNVLNAIAEHTRQDPAVAEEALLRLASVLRTMLDATHAPSWPLSTELELVRAVTELYAVRDRRRYRFQLAWDATPEAQIPPLLLLPMIENAITHGPGSDHEGEVRIEARRDGDAVRVEVENPGAYAGPREGGRGLAMIRERLAIAFGDRARFDIEARGDRTLARLTLPASGTPEVA
ncbi:MAG: histidine kinase, partial [Sandaracinaceae bacterium]|nr:histidine kinase [Sandaracinaceae bacterium]